MKGEVEATGRYRHKKQFGQHFLHDPGVLARIVAAIAPQADDLMVEIGPGMGAMTTPLLAKLGHLHVVEVDRDLVAHLRRSFPPERLSVHQADVLKFDFSGLLPSPAGGRGGGGEGIGGGLRVVGNLPYNISSPILFHLIEQMDSRPPHPYPLPLAGEGDDVANSRRCLFRDMHFMLQKEVVDRMAALPDTPDYGRLSVMLQARFRVMKLFNVSPGAFNPPPKVDSAVVRLAPLPPEAIPYQDGKRFAEIVARAFGQRRKTLRNTLKGLVSEAVFERLGIDPGRRGETLSVADFAALADTQGA